MRTERSGSGRKGRCRGSGGGRGRQDGQRPGCGQGRGGEGRGGGKGRNKRRSELPGLGELLDIVMPGRCPTPLPYAYPPSQVQETPPSALQRPPAFARPPTQLVAVVDAEQCSGCFACADLCAFEAITVEDVAVVAPEKCTACGACIQECPMEAIHLEPAPSPPNKAQR